MQPFTSFVLEKNRRKGITISIGNKIPFGLNTDGELVEVSTVHSGLACNCVCPACHYPLQARKGGSTKHHFAHDPRAKPCTAGYETALHLMAKQLLLEYGHINLPELAFYLSRRHPTGWYVSEFDYVARDTTLEYDNVTLEQRLDDTRPDIILTTDGEPLLVEVAVTHFADREKKDRLRQMGIKAIEIDLSGLPALPTKNQLVEAVIIERDNKKWLSYPAAGPLKKKLTDSLHQRYYELEPLRREAEIAKSARQGQHTRRSHSPVMSDAILYDYNPNTGKQYSRKIPDVTLPAKKKDIFCRHCRHQFQVGVHEEPKLCPLCLDDL